MVQSSTEQHGPYIPTKKEKASSADDFAPFVYRHLDKKTSVWKLYQDKVRYSGNNLQSHITVVKLAAMQLQLN